ncbi:MAG: hypothetical protein WBM13_12410 [Bacteroidia bacterium]
MIAEQIPIKSNTVLLNIYQREVEKIKKTISQLHEDLQYDYAKELEQL